MFENLQVVLSFIVHTDSLESDLAPPSSAEIHKNEVEYYD